MAEDPRAVAIIDAENRAKQVLLNAASDVARYQGSVNTAGRQIERAYGSLQRTTETAYRVIQKKTNDSIEIIEEQVRTVTEELVPAYNQYIDTTHVVTNAEKELETGMGNTNKKILERVSLLDKAAKATITGRAAEAGTEKVTGSVGAGDVVGAAVTTVVLIRFRAAIRKTIERLVQAGRFIVRFRVLLGLLGVSFLIAMKPASLFQEEIKRGAEKAFRPWIKWWGEFKSDFIQELAPTIAITISIFGALGAGIVFVLNKVILPVVKMVGDAIIQIFRTINIVLLGIVDGIIDILQPIVDAVVDGINAMRVAIGIFTADGLTFGQKLKLFGKLVVDGIFKTFEFIIKLAFGFITGFFRVLAGGINAVVFLFVNLEIKLVNIIGNTVRGILNGIKNFAGKFVEFFENPLQNTIQAFNNFIAKAKEFGKKVLNAIIDGAKSAWDTAKSWGRKALSWIGLDMGGGADSTPDTSTIKKMTSAAQKAALEAMLGFKKFSDTIVGRDKPFANIEEMLSAGIGFDPDNITGGIDGVKNKILGFFDALRDRFGIDLKDIAAQVDVDLISSPDLRAGFKKILDKTKLRLELAGLGELNEKLENVNSKDIKVEINPLIQLTVTENVDEARARAILFPLIDQALTEGAAKIGSQVYSANIGNA